MEDVASSIFIYMCLVKLYNYREKTYVNYDMLINKDVKMREVCL